LFNANPSLAFMSCRFFVYGLTLMLLLSFLPGCKKAPLCEQRDGYTVQYVHVPVRNGSAPAYLLVPDQGTRNANSEDCMLPAVILLHDHGARFEIGKEKMVQPLRSVSCLSCYHSVCEDAVSWVGKFYDGAFVGDSLAARGYVVLVTDAIYWGERAASQPEWIGGPDSIKSNNRRLRDAQPQFYTDYLDANGRAWFCDILRDDRSSISYLCSLPFVDTTRIACFGFSMGAYRSWQLAAADSRIAACGASCWMTTVNAVGGKLRDASSYSMYLPEQEEDYPLVAGHIAPRPFFLQYGSRDHVIPAAGTRAAIPLIDSCYHAFSSDNFVYRAYDCDHFFSHDQLEDLLRWLSEAL